MSSRFRTTSALSKKCEQAMYFSISKSAVGGTLSQSCQALIQRMSQMSQTQRTLYSWGIVDEFNEGLDKILGPAQAVGQMREAEAINDRLQPARASTRS